MGGLDPDAVGAHLVVAGAAEIAGLEEVVFDGVVMGRDRAGFGSLLHATGRGDPVEVVGHIAFEPDDRMAVVAVHALVGTAVFFGARRWCVAGQERGRRMAAIATVLHIGHHFILLGMGHCEFEIFDLVPVVGEGLTHHGLGPLFVDIVVAAFAHLGFFVFVVGAGAVGVIAHRSSPQQLRDEQHGARHQDSSDHARPQFVGQSPHRIVLA